MNWNFKEDERLYKLNHSCAHLAAQAIERLYKDAKFWVGPVIDTGFYYDIDLGDVTLHEEDLPKIEKEMKKCAKEGHKLERIELTKEEAIEMFKDDPYKQDLLSRMDDEGITAYRQGEFVDLCRGGHVENTKELKHFKLTKVSGAYFKGDSNNQMLQRVYGVCFDSEDELKDYLDFYEEAKKRDHRKLGKELDLFMISEYGQGFPFLLPNGMTIYHELEKYWLEEHQKADYKLIKTPTILSKELWETSGHWENYKENMYTTKIDGEDYAIKPMNCPGGMLAYKNSLKSYRDLPLRFGELGFVHRHEASGALSGLFRVRAFTQDDAHIFLREEQIEDEVRNIFAIIDKMYKTFNLDYKVEFSTRPEKFIGKIEDWDEAEEKLLNVLNKINKPYKVNEGDGAFYGPKLDVKVIDSLGRDWQCATIQLDMQLPERFDLSYINEEGEKQRPVIIHRVIYGSFERFMGILIEHYAGAFPTWLAPIQVNILPINNKYHLKYCSDLYQELKDKGIRVELDDRDEKFNYKMRESQMRKIPISIIIGDKEIENAEISYRLYGEKNTTTVSKEGFIDFLVKVIKERS